MSWYKEYKDQWKEIIETVAAEEHRTTQMVEKDTIQSMILLGLSNSELPFVFKGGTSLSKAYGLIDRFSEEIVLSLAVCILTMSLKSYDGNRVTWYASVGSLYSRC